MDFITELYLRNAPLAIFGWVSLAGAVICALLINVSDTQVLGISAWIKPFKFFISTTIFVWSMAWYMTHLPQSSVISIYNWVVIAVLAFELFWISFQAARGQLSHFNMTSEFNSMMFGLMGIAITVMTLFTLFIGFQFFISSIDLPAGYLWGIRLGIIIFVIFAFEGGLMGSQLSHTVGAPDGGKGIPFFNWSVSHGDLRIAHFVGMHALQVLPILGFYVFRSQFGIFIVSGMYALLSVFVLITALNGKSLFSSSREMVDIERKEAPANSNF